MTYITTRIPIDAFEFDPYGIKPDWWTLMVVTGKAFEHKTHATFHNGVGEQKARTGDRICLKVSGRVIVMTPEEFKMECRPLDTSKDAAASFTEKIKDAVYNFMEELKGLKR